MNPHKFFSHFFYCLVQFLLDISYLCRSNKEYNTLISNSIQINCRLSLFVWYLQTMESARTKYIQILRFFFFYDSNAAQ